MKALKQVPAVVCEYGKVPPLLACRLAWKSCLQSAGLLCHTSAIRFYLPVRIAAQPIVHYTFIPLIIILGCTLTEPRPTLAQLLGPM